MQLQETQAGLYCLAEHMLLLAVVTRTHYMAALVAALEQCEVFSLQVIFSTIRILVSAQHEIVLEVSPQVVSAGSKAVCTCTWLPCIPDLCCHTTFIQSKQPRCPDHCTTW